MAIEFPEANSVFWKQGRSKTFASWPFKESDKCNSECMAAAGFYVIGNSNEPDLVECFICGKQLDGWEQNDVPWDEHIKHQSNCLFIKINKQDEKDWTVAELYELYKKYKLKQYTHKLNDNVIMLRNEAVRLKNELLSIYKMSRKI